MRIKAIVFGVAVIVILTLGYGLSSSEADSKYVAKVNGEPIENVMLDAALTNFIENQKMLGVDIKEEDKEELRKNILEELISTELLYQESKKADLGDLSEEINQQFDNIKNGFGSEEEFKKVLEDRGISEKELKEDIKKGIYISEFLEKSVYSKIVISEEDKKKEYDKDKERLNIPEQVKASHILISVGQDTSDEDKKNAKAKIDELRKRAVSGEDFAELAKENSEDGSATRGGDLGYFKKGDMVKPFEDAAFSLEKGEISGVVETQFGYHIIKLIDKQASRTLSYEEVEDSIERFLSNKRKREELDKFVEELKKAAKIERY